MVCHICNLPTFLLKIMHFVSSQGKGFGRKGVGGRERKRKEEKRSMYLPTYLPIYLPTYPPVIFLIYPSNHPSIHLSTHPTYPFIIFTSIHPSIHLCLPIYHLSSIDTEILKRDSLCRKFREEKIIYYPQL